MTLHPEELDGIPKIGAENELMYGDGKGRASSQPQSNAYQQSKNSKILKEDTTLANQIAVNNFCDVLGGIT